MVASPVTSLPSTLNGTTIGLSSTIPQAVNASEAPVKFAVMDTALERITSLEKMYATAQDDLKKLQELSKKVDCPFQEYQVKQLKPYVLNQTLPFAQLISETNKHLKTLEEHCKALTNHNVKLGHEVTQTAELQEKISHYWKRLQERTQGTKKEAVAESKPTQSSKIQSDGKTNDLTLRYTLHTITIDNKKYIVLLRKPL